MKPLKIRDIIADIPIIQGGMSVGISLSNLASAVAKEGGIGIIGAAGIGMLEEDFASNFREANKRALRKELKKAKEKTDGIIGVNVMTALSDFEELIKVSCQSGADIVFMGAGLPLKVPMESFKKHNTKTGVIISSARAAKIVLKYWEKNYSTHPDIFVIEGPLAGGHLGFSKEQLNDENYSLEKILPEILKVVSEYEKKSGTKIPVAVAGGIYNGKDIYKFLNAGADAVQLGTRFVATFECDADEEFKKAYINSKKEDIEIIASPVGMPGRVIKNKFTEEVKKGIRRPIKCPWKCLIPCDFRKVPYCIALALTSAGKGQLEDGFVFAGANAYKVEKIISVKELINSLIEEYNREKEKQN